MNPLSLKSGTAGAANIANTRKSQVIPKMSEFGSNFAVFVEEDSPEVIESRRLI